VDHTEFTKAIATAAAVTAGNQIAESLRSELRSGLKSMRDDLKDHVSDEFKKHFGAMDPAQHVIQHNRLERFLKFTDNAQGGFVKGIAGHVGKLIVVSLIGGFAFWHWLSN
jgi:hypothetical protein